MQKLIFSILVLFSFISYSQTKLPENYFENPLEVPLILSGTFGELRSNHFHSGLDIKTQQREGLKVLSTAKGYVSRIKISHWGYGKALYITHPNGYTSVYGHLKKFSPRIEMYIKEQQYKKERFEIELFPDSKTLIVAQKEVIAYSGNTGGSGGPHLHFEIRDRNARPMNPMLFGINIPDKKPPQIRAGVAYVLGDSAHVNLSNKTKDLVFKRNKNGELVANPIQAYGRIGFGVNTIDKQDGALNNNGIYKLEMTVNGEKTYSHQLYRFSFGETRYINTLVDYPRNHYRKQRIQKCFVEPANKLTLYSNLVNNGILDIKDGLSYSVRITASDFKGNSETLTIPIKGKKNTKIKRVKKVKTNYFISHKSYKKFTDSIVNVVFPSESFYKDQYIDFSFKNKIATIHNPSIPLHKNFTLTFNINHLPKKQHDKTYIAKLSKNGALSYVNTKRKPGKLYALSRNLGKYTLAVDSIPPSIKAVNFKKEQWLTNYRYLKFKISDRHSGIKSYRGEIDGKWILLEYDPKKRLLVFDFTDLSFTGTKHRLKITVRDQLNNTNTYIATFNKKE